LVRNPRVLEFDNKRNWFFQKLKRKKDQAVAVGSLPLNIRRQYVFEDSFHALQRRTGDEIKYGKLNVKFYNEDGVDAGGVTREWYSVLAQQIFDPNFGEFHQT
jgi:E3 ubiquitin-protein ligase HUWE1